MIKLEGRVVALDGLRGIAAVIVVFGHSFNAIELPMSVRQEIVRSPLALLLSSSGAVQLFFVLSGYVLASSLSRVRGWTHLLQFFVKRIFRIHPPYIFAVLFAWGASHFYQAPAPEHAQGLSPMLAHVHLDLSQLMRSFWFPGNAFLQLPVGWTLRVELVFSLLLPGMVLLARRLHWVALLIGSAYLLTLPLGEGLLWYAIDFSLGIAAYQERERLARWLTGLSTLPALLWVIAAAAVFSVPHMLWSEPISRVLLTREQPLNIGVLGLGSVGLVIAAVFVPAANRLLSARPVAFLGKLSFSIYLLHFTLLILLAPIVDRPTTWPFALLLLGLVLGGTIGLSVLSYRWVEKPSIRAGNLVCDWIAERARTSSLRFRLINE